LAGIEIYKTPVDTVLRKLGKPNELRQVHPATDEVIGGRLYIWKRSNISIKLGTEFSPKPIFKGNLRETPSSVTVDGTASAIGSTGHGLKLGDLYTAIGRIYGSRYLKKGRNITIQWETTTTLVVGWNEQGVIDHIALIGPE
jgi:hypothetical protein